MGLWSRLVAPWRQKSSIEDWFREFGWSNRSNTGHAITQVTAMQVAAVMACVSILAEDVGKLPVHVYRRQKDGGKKIAADHYLEPLLQRPNNWQSRMEFWEQMMGALLLRGNAYAAVVSDHRGYPSYLVPVNPDQVWLWQAPDGDLFYQVARHGLHEMAVLKPLPLMVPASDMIHLRWITFNSLWGASRIGLARDGIALALSQQELAARLAGNSTNLGGVLTTDQKLTPELAEAVKKRWKERMAGLVNAGEVAVLERGLKWERLGMTAQDAEFVASRNLQIAEIARMFRMPPHKIGVSERMAGTQLEQLDQDYMNNTVSSYLERIEQKLTHHFNLDLDGVFVEFDISRFLRASIQTRMNSYRTAIMSGVMTPNQASRAEGLPDDPNGDVRLQPANMVPLGSVPMTTAGPGSDTTGAGADGGRGDALAVPPDEEPNDAPQD
jgi:HK97 family phage portal protein